MATQSAQVTAKPRSELGSRANKRLRDSGLFPGVIYGHKEAVVPVTLPKKEVVNHLNHGAHLFDLALDGKSEKVLVKEVQYDHLGMEVIHVDFARVSLDEKVEVTVPLELKGDAQGRSRRRRASADHRGAGDRVPGDRHPRCRFVTTSPRWSIDDGPAHQGPEAARRA